MLSRNFRMFSRSFVNYVQGQAPEPRVREYFYFIDHQGMVKKHKDKNKFLNFLKNKYFF